MGEGFLLVNIYARETGRPVEGALVTVYGGGVSLSRKTDATGRTEKIALPSPDRKYSLEPQLRVRPYARYLVKAEKPGLRGVLIDGVQIFDGQTALQNIIMNPGPQEDFEFIEIPENHLWA